MTERILTVADNREVARGIYKMTLTGDISEVRAGQFVHLSVPSDSRVLRRPFGVSEYDADAGTLSILYAVVGDGTRILSEVEKGEKLPCILGLGNGFPEISGAKKIALLGGGMGAVLFPALAKELKEKGVETVTYLGFASVDKIIVKAETERFSEVKVSTDDGSFGKKGYAADLLREDIASGVKFDAAFCCGPEPMFRALQKFPLGVPTYISLEERMGCGVGACLTCSCKIKTSDGDKYLRVCKDGPVFPIEKVVF